ncbi:Zinc finger y-chromosomal protein 1 [Plakobranchus ocellatus]|uniref:Zinc finger y-chromosomal protein 1 n=1 Tax=Plakobranchus ocellatus TaxID=259542 RepID=A0AAV4B3U3_9GAST|nr:Zinc finger y-chromosomal protein 1 [Plakobranchus ocellatus]
MDVERTTSTNTSATTEANESEFEDTENEINAGVTAMESRGDEHYIYQNESNNGLPVLYENTGALLAAPASDAGTGDTCAEGNGENEIMSEETRQTITLNLDAATQYLLQQHGITTQTIEMEDGTYQLFDQPVIQVQREDGTLEAQTLHVEVLQALQGELVQQLQPTLDVGYPLAGPVDGEEATEAQPKIEENAIAKEAFGGDYGSKGDDKEESQDSTSQPNESNDVLKDLKEEIVHCASQQSEKVHEQISKSTTTNKTEDNSKKEPSREEADFTNPIPLSNQAVITVKGKKCVLSYDAKTQQVCAYPIKSKTGKPRGRPRLTEAEKVAARQRKIQQQMEAAARVSSISTPSEQSSAAETLLELSNTGLGGIRRSGRARKKTKVLDDFEELEDSEGEEGPAFEDNHEKDPDISIDLPEVKRRRLLIAGKEALPAHGTRTVAGPPVPAVKRGRGRPRRYPPPGHQNAPKSIPAVMLPSADGQTFVMAPIQELQNLRRQLPHLVPKPPEQGTEVIPTSTAQGDGSDSQNLVLECSDADSLPLDAAGVLDSSNIIPQALQGDNIPLIGDTVDSSDQGNGLDTSPASLLNLITHTSAEADKNKSDMSDSQQQPTVIQIPDNILASLGFKKDPVKIGLKASERELEKLKCPKCDFQGYYAQQYRNHIASHGDDIQKCKCCSFLSLDTEELLQHFKENHPRCICPECGYMAEHAYIIKRHMMRHDIKSCTCNICGKVYKDMYILKMHIKMVHMPAEVLFECDVCSKKFTRKAHLKRHMRIHEPEKPFKCSLCDYRLHYKGKVEQNMHTQGENNEVRGGKEEGVAAERQSTYGEYDLGPKSQNGGNMDDEWEG